MGINQTVMSSVILKNNSDPALVKALSDANNYAIKLDPKDGKKSKPAPKK